MDSVESLEAHVVVLGLLGRLHREPPDDAALARLGAVLDDWPLARSAASDAGLSHWRRSRTLGETAETIERDHDRLYGVSAAAIVPPYESVHREEEGLVFGETTLRVRQDYVRFGLRVPEPNRLPDDHLGLEFDFLSQALARAVDCANRDDAPGREAALDTARRFLREHLLVWAPAVLDRAAETAQTEFMTGLTRLSLAALRSGQQLLGVDPAAT